MFVFELGYIQMYSHTHAYVCRGVYRERAYECTCVGTERDRESERHTERDRETKKKTVGEESTRRHGLLVSEARAYCH